VRVGSRVFALLALGLLASGCATRPAARLVVDEINIVGARQVDPSEILDRLATRATATALGFTLQYEVYDKFVVDRDLQRIERYYRSKGFYGARVQAARVTTLDDAGVAIEVQVHEGKPTTVTAVRIDPRGVMAPDAGYALGKAAKLKPGDRFDEETYDEMRSAMKRALTDNGHAHARIDGGFLERDLAPDGGNAVALDPSRDMERIRQLSLDLDRQKSGEGPDAGAVDSFGHAVGHGEADASGNPVHPARPKNFGVRLDVVQGTAEIFLVVDAGPLSEFGDIEIEGLGSLPEGQVRAALGLRPGQRYSTAELESARHALLELGVFSSVEFVAAVPKDGSPVIPVTFKVARAPLHTITLGGGVQADVLQTDGHFTAGYEHLNFLGGLRKLTMQAKPGTVLFPTNLQNLLPPNRFLPQIKSRAELVQPQFLEARTRGILRSEFLVYPFLLPARSQAEVADVVVGYYEIREAAGIDRSFFRGKLSLASLYNLQLSYPFTYFGPLDEGIRRVLISYLSFAQTVDLRDQPLKPRRGMYFSNEIQYAGGPFGGDADDFRVQPDLRFYAPASKRITIATRTSMGFLLPRSYGESLSRSEPDPSIDPLGARAFETARNRDLQILFFRAFFSGGPNSNRGYPIRGVGPRGIAPFTGAGGGRALRDCVGRAPGGSGVSGAASQVAGLAPVNPELCGVPLGGLSLWEASIEVRFQLTDHLSTLLFLDGSDVNRRQLSVRLDYPHVSTGSGLRYDTPVGPIRLDVGYAIPGLQRIGGELDPFTEGQPATLLGLPVAVNIAVGEAF
jgi:outer membrane protein assembly factor BamA